MLKLLISTILFCLILGCNPSGPAKVFIHPSLEITEEEYESIIHLQLIGRGKDIDEDNVLVLNRLKNLESLSVFGKGQLGLQEVIAQLKDLEHFTYLSYSTTLLDSIPGNIGQLGELRDLDLSENRLESIDCSIFGKHLEELYLSDNRLEGLPQCLEPNHSLKVLSLAGNINLNVDDVVSLCQHFHELEYLNLSNCDLISIPEQISTLSQIQTLDLSYNHFREFPAGLAKLSGLKYLHLVSTDLPQWSLDSLAELLPNCKIVLSHAEGF